MGVEIKGIHSSPTERISLPEPGSLKEMRTQLAETIEKKLGLALGEGASEIDKMTAAIKAIFTDKTSVDITIRVLESYFDEDPDSIFGPETIAILREKPEINDTEAFFAATSFLAFMHFDNDVEATTYLYDAGGQMADWYAALDHSVFSRFSMVMAVTHLLEKLPYATTPKIAEARFLLSRLGMSFDAAKELALADRLAADAIARTDPAFPLLAGAKIDLALDFPRSHIATGILRDYIQRGSDFAAVEYFLNSGKGLSEKEARICAFIAQENIFDNLARLCIIVDKFGVFDNKIDIGSALLATFYQKNAIVTTLNRNLPEKMSTIVKEAVYQALNQTFQFELGDDIVFGIGPDGGDGWNAKLMKISGLTLVQAQKGGDTYMLVLTPVPQPAKFDTSAFPNFTMESSWRLSKN
jgi:hypothetical protein